jgi:hypothetical protein
MDTKDVVDGLQHHQMCATNKSFSSSNERRSFSAAADSVTSEVAATVPLEGSPSADGVPLEALDVAVSEALDVISEEGSPAAAAR